MSKKLLNEAQVRRFMGLAGIEPTVVSNKLTEWYTQLAEEADEELPPEEEEEDAEGAPPVDDAPVDEMPPEPEEELPPEPEAELAPEAPAGDAADLAMELIQALAPVFEKHGVELSTDEGPIGGDAPMDDMAADAPMDDMAADAPMDDMAADAPMGDVPPEEDELELGETKVEMDENEIVNEVAKRVARRILEAKKAKSKMDKALGKNK